MLRGNVAWLVAVPLLVLGGATLSLTAPTARDKEYDRVRLIVDVLAEIDRHYVKDLTDEQRTQLVEDMINGGLERLDRYSEFFNPDNYKKFSATSKGDFGGVGIHLGTDPKTGLPMVQSPMIGTPAYDAGMLAGDLILKINDRPTEQMTPNDVVRLVQGEAGSDVSFVIRHEGAKESETVTMKRARIEVPVVLGAKRQAEDQRLWDFWVEPDSKIAYIRLTQFTDHTAPELKKALEALEKDGVKGFVLDLRDNPGGLLVSAIEVSDLFLTGGKIVSTKDRSGLGRSWDAKEEGTFLQPADQKPMAVIVNRNSASASELVSAALQDNGRAVVVGERSFGKGSVQKVFEIGLDAQPMALKLTTETYWRPSGKNIHRFNTMKDSDEWGVKPDAGFDVKLSDEQRLEYLKGRRERDTVRGKNAATKPDAAFKDLMLDKAVEAVKGKMPK